MPHLPQRVVNVADFFLCQFHEVLSRWREWEGVVFRGEGEDIQIIEALGLGGGRREASRGNVRDVTSEPGLQGEVGFQQERGRGSSTKTPEEVAGRRLSLAGRLEASSPSA